METIGIIGAEPAEIQPLLAVMQVKESINRACYTFHQAIYEDIPVVVTECGVGKVSAAANCQLLISEFKVDKVIFTGTAGAINPALRGGDIVISTETTQHDFDVTAFGRQPGEPPPPGRRFVPANAELRAAAVAACHELGFTCTSGRILTGDQFVSDKLKAQHLVETFAGDVVEMEGGAVAQTCDWNGIPFVIIRSVSDTADAESPATYLIQGEHASRKSAQIVLKMLTLVKVGGCAQ